MKRKKAIEVITSLLLVFFCFSSIVYAATIVFKSGKTVEGEIIKKTDEYIKVDIQGISITYYLDEIESIDGKKPGLSSTKAVIPVKDTECTQEGDYYINEEYGVKIWHPKDWEVFDRRMHPEVFKTLLPPGATDVDTGLIFALSCGKDWSNLEPLIMLIAQQVPDNLKNLSADDLVVMVEQNLRQFSLPPDSEIEYPTVVIIAGKKLVKHMISTTAQDLSVKNISYQFIKDTKLYLVSCIANQNTFDTYRKVFADIAGSIEVY